MKQLLRLLLLMLLPCIGIAQEDETASKISISDFPVALYNGIPDITIPLLQTGTANPGLTFDFTLVYDLMANMNSKIKTNQFGDIWKSNSIGMIVREQAQTISLSGVKWHNIPDELHYRYFADNPDSRDPHDIFSFNALGITGKFYLLRKNHTLQPVLQESSDFVDIKINYTSVPVDANKTDFNIASFTLTDKNGFSYIFNLYDTEEITAMVSHSGTMVTADWPINYYLTKITDNKNNDLITYSYPSTTNKKSLPSSILINRIGKLVFTKEAGNDIITWEDLNQNPVKKFKLLYGGLTQAEKIALMRVELSDPSSLKKDTYKIEYLNRELANVGGTPRNAGNGMTYFGCDSNFGFKGYSSTNRLIRKITNPMGGSTFYDFEPNTISTKGAELNYEYGGVVFNGIIEDYYKNPVNSSIEEIPLNYDNVLKRYYFTTSHPFFIHYNVTNLNLEDPLNPGVGPIPDKSILLYAQGQNGQYYEYTNTSTSYNNCHNSKWFVEHLPSHNFYLEQLPNLQYSEVKIRVYKKKPYEELVMEMPFVGFRIKKITLFDDDLSESRYTSGNHTMIPASETRFAYKQFNHPNRSSGSMPPRMMFTINFPVDHYLKYVFYENVSVKTSGKGYIDYYFDLQSNYTQNGLAENMHINAHLLKTIKYDETGKQIEELQFNRAYTIPSESVVPVLEANPMLVVKNEKITAHTYAGTTAKKLVTISESTYDTLTRNLTLRKITDVNNNQVFEEAFTFVKKHQTYFPETVKKYKNSQLLNQSAFEYTPVTGNPQVVNLSKSYVAKSTLPLEIDKEITRYDAYGNVLEYKTKTGRVVSQIWGYDGTQLVAELKNVAYNSISAATITAIQTASNAAGYNETNLNTAFTQLRSAHADGFITTYTYKPLVGMTSVTDANGRRESYQYDSFNRLYRVVNHEGQVTKEYQYNTKNQ